MRCAHPERVLLIFNALILAWAVHHVHYAVTFEFPGVMTNQTCCKKNTFLSTGECCPNGHHKFQDDACARGPPPIAGNGIRKSVEDYRWMVAVILCGYTLVPYHVLLSTEPKTAYSIFGGLTGMTMGVAFVMFIAANTILGYGMTTHCKNPGTKEYNMLYEHAPYDFWMLAIGAWAAVVVIAAAVAIVVIYLIVYMIISFVLVCAGYQLGCQPEPGDPDYCCPHIVRNQAYMEEHTRRKKEVETRRAARKAEEKCKAKAAAERNRDQGRAVVAEIRVVVEHTFRGTVNYPEWDHEKGPPEPTGPSAPPFVV